MNNFQHGYDSAVRGPNTLNCHFTLFHSHEAMKEWERGNALGKRHIEMARAKRKKEPTDA